MTVNYKQTLLTSPQIDAVRDKTLKLGCLVEWEKPPFRAIWTSVVVDYSGANHDVWVDAGQVIQRLNQRQVRKIIGHPITHTDLLRALPDEYWMSQEGEVSTWKDIDQGFVCFYLPLNHRTIEDIPEDDPCWEQLCKVFDLV